MENTKGNQFRRFLHNHATSGDAEQVVSWIENGSEDALLDDLLTKEWKLISTEDIRREVDPALMLTIQNKIGTLEIKHLESRGIFYRVALRIAAVLVIGLITTVWIVTQFEGKDLAPRTVLTPFGARMTTVLPDGTKVWLNTHSQLTFPGEFGKKREVELAGEAYFDVASSKKPFVVKCFQGTVEATGTSFNIRSFEGESFVTTLEEGTVNIRFTDGKTVTLKPDYQVRKCEKPSQVKVQKVETYLYTSWKDGKLIFRKEPLGNMVRRLESWYNVKIELKDKSLEDIRFTGTLEMESFSEVLELIKATTPIRYTFNTDSRVLSIYKTKKP